MEAYPVDSGGPKYCVSSARLRKGARVRHRMQRGAFPEFQQTILMILYALVRISNGVGLSASSTLSDVNLTCPLQIDDLSQRDKP